MWSTFTTESPVWRDDDPVTTVMEQVVQDPRSAADDAGAPDARRRLPSVEVVRRTLDDLPHTLAVRCARDAVDAARDAMASGVDIDPESVLVDARRRADRAGRASLRPLINATGVLLHTNLGRAPLGEDAVQAVADVAGTFSSIEYDVVRGERGSRHDHVGHLLAALTGAEDGLVVNNNAAAVLLVLSAMARDRSVVVSRGELVEIGGGFRIPEIIAQSGRRLIEVGTTNKTRLVDYERALDERGSRTQGAHLQLPGGRVHRGHAGASTGDARCAGDRRSRVGPPRRTGAMAPGAPGVARRRTRGAPDARRRRRRRDVLGRQAAGRPAGGHRRGARRDARGRPSPSARTRAARRQDDPRRARGRLARLPARRRQRHPLLDDGHTHDRGTTPARRRDRDHRAGGGGRRHRRHRGWWIDPGARIPSVGLAVGTGDPVGALAALRDHSIVGRMHGGSIVADLRTVDPVDDPHLAKALLTLER